MNRRCFIGGIVATVAAIRLWRKPSYGFMDVNRWVSEGHVGKRVLCNGVDITDRCRKFDDIEGYAVCLLHDWDDNLVFDWDTLNAVEETLHGRIEVVG